MRLRLKSALLVLAITLLSGPAHGQSADLQQQLISEYQGKTLFLRGFYAGDRLSYTPDGIPVSPAFTGDWTSEGVVSVNEIKLSGTHLRLKGQRLLVSGEATLHFFEASSKKGKKKGRRLEIDLELGPNASSAAKIDAALSRVFLTPDDDFVTLIPDYWRTCILDGLTGKNNNCRFAPEVLAIPGVRVRYESTDTASQQQSSNSTMARIGPHVSPPRVTRQRDPEFTDSARRSGCQGTATLMLVVNAEGSPTNIRIAKPLGCGLDTKAVQAVQAWRFNPAMKDGKPVSVEIAVEVEFHLY